MGTLQHLQPWLVLLCLSATGASSNCRYDVCMEANRTTVLCRTLEQYALACLEEGIPKGDWREVTLCALQCPESLQFSTCAPACPASCSDFTAPADCNRPSQGGCDCLPGYILGRDECLPFRECSCTILGWYHQAGQSFMTEDCHQLCTCTNSSSLSCIEAACAQGENCTVVNGTRGCYREEPEDVTGYIIAAVLSGLALLALLSGTALYAQCTTRKHVGGEGGALDPACFSAHAKKDLIAVNNMGFEKA